MTERTLVIVKPDAVARGLVGEMVGWFEARGLRVVAMRRLLLGPLAEKLYAEWRDRDFYEELVAFNASGPVVAMVLEGPSAAMAARSLIGATDPAEAEPASLRGGYGTGFPHNAVHASHDADRAPREIALLFADLKGRYVSSG